MRKKLITLLLTMSMVTTMFAGCGNNEEVAESESKETVTTVVESTTVSESVEEEIPNFNSEGYPVVDEEITLKVLIMIADANVDATVEISEMPAIKKITELTGIKTEWEIIRNSEWSTKFNLIMATDEYPDVIISNATDYEEYGAQQGILIPVDELTEKYMPIYNERIAMESYDVTAKLAASDGKKYGVGFMVAENNSTYTNYFLNQSWLDTLKLETPTDVESLTEVLRAFRDGDPNGNGDTTDEIPMSLIISDNSSNYSVSQMMGFFGMPVGVTSWLYIDDNKQVQFAPVQDAFRESMEWLHMCYDEGLLDIESISQDANTVSTKMTTGKLGFFPGWRLVDSGFEPGVEEQMTLWIPEDAVFFKQLELATAKAFITKTNKYPEATARWLDTWLDTENQFSTYYDVQNQDQDPTKYGWYYAENGKISTNPKPKEMVERTFLSNAGMFFAPPTWYFATANMNAARIQKAEYSDAYIAAGILQKYSNTYLDLVKLNAEQKEASILLKTDSDNAVKEYMAAFIKEGVTDKNWDEFVKILKDMGIDDYVKMYQDGIDKLDMGK